MNSNKRVGVVEIGSRSVRLLVADIAPSGYIRRVDSGSIETGLEAAINQGDGELERTIEKTRQAVDQFWEVAQRLGPDHAVVFGTQAVRRLSRESKRLFDRLKENIPGSKFMKLERKEEAWGSFLAGISSLRKPATSGQEILVMDQGAGSIELALGHVSDTSLELFNHQGYPLGTQSLARELKKRSNDLHIFQKWLKEEKFGSGDRKTDWKLIHVIPSTTTLILGSAATKLAWLGVRKFLTEPYSPSRVDGVIIPLTRINRIIEESVKHPDEMRHFIDPKNPDSDEYEIVLSGGIELLEFLERFHITEFTVSGKGTRHGVAWALAYGNPRRHQIRLF